LPCGRHVRPNHRHVLDSERHERYFVQRRQRLHDERYLSGRRVLARHHSDLPRARHVSHARHVQPEHWYVFDSERHERYLVQRRQRLHG